MWFQDLFNYDFRRTEMCVIPYGTQEGEISFCAYNTGIGWRNIIEKMHMTATLSKWYGEHGRHNIYAGGRNVDLNDYEHNLQINAEHAARGVQVSDGPANSREEKKLERDRKMAEAEAKGEAPPAVNGGASKRKILTPEEEAQLMKMYREQVLKEPSAPSLVQIGNPAVGSGTASDTSKGQNQDMASGASGD